MKCCNYSHSLPPLLYITEWLIRIFSFWQDFIFTLCEVSKRATLKQQMHIHLVLTLLSQGKSVNTFILVAPSAKKKPGPWSFQGKSFSLYFLSVFSTSLTRWHYIQSSLTEATQSFYFYLFLPASIIHFLHNNSHTSDKLKEAFSWNSNCSWMACHQCQNHTRFHDRG